MPRKRVRKNVQNIVQTWLDAATDDGRRLLKEAVETLNVRTGRRYTSSRINEMLNGRSMDRETYVAMLAVALPRALKEEGISLTARQTARIVKKLG